VLLKGAELLTGIFGYWPSFHDAEVVRLALERKEPYESGPDLAADVYTFETTEEVGGDGRYLLKHEVLVSFRFSGIDSLRIEGFNNQNALWGLEIIDIRSRQLEYLRYEVHFAASFGVGAEFFCRDIEIEGVRPWEPERP
jgi:hypothetical protein